MKSIEEQFEAFFQFCRKQEFTSKEMHSICQPLWQKRKRKLFGCVSLMFLASVCFVIWSDSLSWFLSAIGRILLIQLLPYWDWTTLYNAKCLLERNVDSGETNKLPPALGKYETNYENCVLCSTLSEVATLSNVSFSYLESTYLERGLPVIVQDSHAAKSLNTLLNDIQHDAMDFIASEPCDLLTNLVLKKFFTIDLALQKIRSMQLPHATAWFLQLRNCRFAAVKSSRAFVTRPYYYPLHLSPFYSSWLLMSHNYQFQLREIFLQGLIFIQQLEGSFDIHLRPKQPCGTMCPLVNLRLYAGEALVFSTDLWTLSYGTENLDVKVPSIATVLEIDWHT